MIHCLILNNLQGVQDLLFLFFFVFNAGKNKKHSIIGKLRQVAQKPQLIGLQTAKKHLKFKVAGK